jgi:hypothetical protein
MLHNATNAGGEHELHGLCYLHAGGEWGAMTLKMLLHFDVGVWGTIVSFFMGLLYVGWASCVVLIVHPFCEVVGTL